MSVHSQELTSYLEKNDVVLFSEHAALVILIYDYFLTLGPEISFVWTRGPWNLGKMLFFLIRYSGFVSASLLFYVDTSRSIPLPKCPSFMNAAFYSNICVIAITEFAFGLRVWALWGTSKKVGICLVAITTVLTAFILYKIVTIQETQSTFSNEIFHISGRCPPQFSGNDGLSGSYTISVSFIMIVVYESVVLVLTLLKASRLEGWRSGSRFINGFLSQGVAYNCLILAASTVNIIARYKLPSAYVNLLTDLQLVTHSVLTSRMMLFLRKNAFQCETFSTDERLTGLVALDPGISEVRNPAELCPRMSVFNPESPSESILEHQPPLTQEDRCQPIAKPTTGKGAVIGAGPAV